MTGNKHTLWCRYSLVFQSGALTISWAWLVILMTVVESQSRDWAMPVLIAMATGLFILGALLTVLWPAHLIMKLKKQQPAGLLFPLWILFGLFQWPLGPILALFQGWCLWKGENAENAGTAPGSSTAS